MLPKPRRSLARALCAIWALSLAAPRSASAELDRAARGLDAFIHAPDHVTAGGVVPLQIGAIGFPTVVAHLPLADATVEVAWAPSDSTAHGQPAKGLPPSAAASVRAQTDGHGMAHLDLRAPVRAGKHALLIAVRFGPHERVREVELEVEPALAVRLYVSDRNVTPGSSVRAWAFVQRADTGEPAPGARVAFELKDGEVLRSRVEARAGAGGVAEVAVQVPRLDLPGVHWSLSARSVEPEGAFVSAAETLSPKDETPGAPSLEVRLDDAARIEPGSPAPFTVTVKDGAGDPVAGLPVRYRVARAGTRHTSDTAEAWEAESTLGKTDVVGAFHGLAPMPPVVRRKGLPVQIDVRAEVAGHEITGSATVDLVSRRGPLGASRASTLRFSVVPEGGVVAPGTTQTFYVRAEDLEGEPAPAEVEVQGDGLSARVQIGELGVGAFSWSVPRGIGAHHEEGECAVDVAAHVRVRRTDTPGTDENVCVPVDRDARAWVRPEEARVSADDVVSFHVEGNIGGRGMSVLAQSTSASMAVSSWLAPGSRSGRLRLPKDALGVWTIDAVSLDRPEVERSAVPGSVLVVPRRIPKLTATRTGGRSAPLGEVIVEADVRDQSGAPMPARVSAIVMDDRGQRDPLDLGALDTRTALTRGLAREAERDALLESDDLAYDRLARAALGSERRSGSAVVVDPGAEASESLRRAFEAVMHSLEGAVQESLEDPERAGDVRRRGPHGWELNPEIEQLMADALSGDDVAATPGGEPLTLSDLRVVDPQVDFNHAARRVARRRLFQILLSVRSYVHEHRLSAAEPLLRDPNALLRCFVRDGQMQAHDLVDPWGGTFRFVRTPGPSTPFLSVIPGFALHAPGPDGRVGTADDVRDPFERVLRSGSPYAAAVKEDDLVFAKGEIVVGDETVERWSSLFDELTGSSMDGSSSGGLGLAGSGSGDGGSGYGAGHGRIGGAHRARATSELPAYTRWLSPVRTDARGHVRLTVPLGPVETTWRIWLVALPDGGTPATTSIAVAASLPISAKVDAGATWVEGDRGEVEVTVRNRTAKPVSSVVSVEPRAGLILERAGDSVRSVALPAAGLGVVRIALRATAPGPAELGVRVRTPGYDDDVLAHSWRVVPPGEALRVTRSAWISAPSRLTLPLEEGVLAAGPMRLVVEHGVSSALARILDSVEPDSLKSPSALADAVEVAGRVRSYFLARRGADDAVVRHADQTLQRAAGRLRSYPKPAGERSGLDLALRVAQPWLAATKDEKPPSPPPSACPNAEPPSLRARVAQLEAAPTSEGQATLACWDAYVSSTLSRLAAEPDPVAIALTILARVDRPDAQAQVAPLASRLAETVAFKVQGSGTLALPPPYAADRAARAIVMASLLRAAPLVPALEGARASLSVGLALQQDASGGFGSTEATRSALRALLSVPEAATVGADVSFVAAGQAFSAPRELVHLGAGDSRAFALDQRVDHVDLRSDGAGVFARLERPVLRFWRRPPEGREGVHLEVDWPSHAKVGERGVLNGRVRVERPGSSEVEVRIPLPPGVSMSEPADNVRQSGGAVLVSVRAEDATLQVPFTVPVRFALRGTFTVPEASAYAAHLETAQGHATARPLVVEGP